MTTTTKLNSYFFAWIFSLNNDFLSITRELSTMIKYTEMNPELIFALINSYGITKTTC